MMFFFNILVNVYMFFKSLFMPRNHTIRRIAMTYTAPPKPSAEYSNFWKAEERYWDSEESRVWTVVTNRFDEMGETPEGVKDQVFTVKYFYDGKRYRMVTRNPEFEWPPLETQATFRAPIISAFLVNKDNPVRNVTKKLLKVMGPRRDFHGQSVPIEDLFTFDDYTDITVRDIMGVTKTIERTTSCLQIL